MHKYLESLFGASPATLARGARFGLRDAYQSSRLSYTVVEPWANRHLHSIPTIAYQDLLGPKGASINLRVSKYEDGMLPMCDVIGLLSILVAERPHEVLEIGTYMGHTTKAMAENVPEARIHTVDLPVDFDPTSCMSTSPPKDDLHLIARRIVGREFKGQPCEERIIQHFGDTSEIDFSTFGRPNFFFIDGSHTYEYCRNDSERCLALCEGNGTFLWHDCDNAHPGVVQCLCDWRKDGRNVVRLKDTSLAYWKSS